MILGTFIKKGQICDVSDLEIFKIGNKNWKFYEKFINWQITTSLAHIYTKLACEMHCYICLYAWTFIWRSLHLDLNPSPQEQGSGGDTNRQSNSSNPVRKSTLPYRLLSRKHPWKHPLENYGFIFDAYISFFMVLKPSFQPASSCNYVGRRRHTW